MADTYTEKDVSNSSADHQASPKDEIKRDILDVDTSRPDRLNAAFENPLANVPDDQLLRDVEDFCDKYDLMEHLDDMKKGALTAKNYDDVDNVDFLDPWEKEIIVRERTHKWDHPKMLYYLCGTSLYQP